MEAIETGSEGSKALHPGSTAHAHFDCLQPHQAGLKATFRLSINACKGGRQAEVGGRCRQAPHQIAQLS